jgi:general secretion pathway protein L
MFNLDAFLGIEIHDERLCFASVKKGFHEYTLKNQLVIDHYLNLPESDLFGIVQKFTKNNGFNKENIIVGIPRNQVIIREAELPLEVEENLDMVVHAQVEKFEPAAEEDSCFDYQIISRDEEKGRIVMQVSMARKQVIEDNLDLLKRLDLFPAAMRVSTNGLQGLLTLHKDGISREAVSMVIRVNHNYTEVLAVDGYQNTYSSVIAATAQDLTVDLILAEISILLSRYENLIEKINRIYMEGELDPELVEKMKERIGDVEVLHKGIQLESRAGKVDNRVMTAIGLAVSASGRSAGSKVNLIPPEKRMVITRPNLFGTFLLAGLLLVMLAAILSQGYFQKKVLLQEIDAQIQTLQSEVDEVINIRNKVEERKALLASLQEMLLGRQTTLLILKDLTERIPDNTYLQNIQFQGDEITMQGYSDQISSLIPVLQDSPFLETVKTNWIQQDPRNRDKERFNIGATIKKMEETEEAGETE